jgi:hypothetical protein
VVSVMALHDGKNTHGTTRQALCPDPITTDAYFDSGYSSLPMTTVAS